MTVDTELGLPHTTRVGVVQGRFAIAIVAFSTAFFVAVMPFVREPLAAVPAFIPAYESALALLDTITAVLLFAQFVRTERRSFLVIAAGYLFNAFMMIPHALTFPGVFSATGMLGAGTQTTAWLYSFWHGGFPLFVIAYAFMNKEERSPNRVEGSFFLVAMTVLAVLVLAVLLTVLATIGEPLLPRVIENGNYSMLVAKGVSPSMLLLCALALWLLWKCTEHVVIDVWLMVVMWVWMLDIMMSAVIGSARYDLGWYAGRAFGLIAATFLLGILLLEMSRLYGSLERSLDLARAQDRELLQSRADLAHAQRLDAIGKLTGGVAHDFNNVLQVIAGNLNLLTKDVAGNDNAEQRLRRALTGVARGARLASQLLAFGRRQPLEPKVINPGKMLRGLDEVFQRALGDEIEIETVVAAGLWNTVADRALLENALLNLAINARDAMAAGGKLTIEAGNAFLDEEYCRAYADAKPGQYVLLAVSDTGSGISADQLPRVFEPFFTTKDESQGTGLGLSMVYGFVKQSGGHITIYSEVGQGTTVRLYLPRSTLPEPVAAPRSQEKAVGGAETILVVEDDDAVRFTAVETLIGLGYRVLHAPDAMSALAIVESGAPIDLVFSDVVMPGALTSADMAKKIQTLVPGVAVLFTSGYTGNAIVHGGKLDAGVDLISKPYRHEDLARKIRTLLQQRPISASDDAVGSTEPSAAAGELEILLVEDNEDVRQSTADVIASFGHRVTPVSTGEGALEKLIAFRYDVLFADISLPSMSGLELAREAIQAYPAMRIIIASGHDVEEGRIPGVYACLRKPYELKQLEEMLQTARPRNAIAKG